MRMHWLSGFVIAVICTKSGMVLGGDQKESPPGSKEAVTALVSAMKGAKDDVLFTHARKSLVKIGAPAGPAVTDLLNQKEEPKLRQAAAKALGDIGVRLGGNAPAAAKALADSLKQDKDNEVRKNAARALGKIGVKPLGVQALIDALQDPAPEVQQAAAEALGEIFAQSGSENGGKEGAGDKARRSSDIRELLEHRLAIAAEIHVLALKGFKGGQVQFDRVLQAEAALLVARLGLCETKSERLEVHEEMVKVAEKSLEVVQMLAKTNQATRTEVLKAQARLLEARIARESAVEAK